MKLTELNATFLRIDFARADRGAAEKNDGIPPTTHWQFEAEIAKADGLHLLCPRCFEANGGPEGTHSVVCWFRTGKAPADLSPGPGRWTPKGTGLHDLTFIPGDPPQNISVQLSGSCAAHFFIENGEVRNG